MEKQKGIVSIARVYGFDNDKVKIEVLSPDNQLVIRLYMSLEDFSKAIFGLAQLSCEYATTEGK